MGRELEKAGQLAEVRPVRQDAPGLRKRWFRTVGLDLFVWSRGDSVSRLQLGYKRAGGEFCLSWSEDEGYRHEQVDDGEGHPLQYKASPILLPDGEFPLAEVLERFRLAAGGINRSLRELVLAVIEGFGKK